MNKILIMFATAVLLAGVIMTGGCGGSSGSALTPTPIIPSTTLSATNLSVAATASADVFTLHNASTSGYSATITGGFSYLNDKISYPAGGVKPSAMPGGVNDLADGNVDLTWISNGQIVTIRVSGLASIDEQALESNAVPAIYTTY